MIIMMKHALSILGLILFLFVSVNTHAAVTSGRWEPMPLAEKAGAKVTKNAVPADGLATKGEGFQYVFALSYAPSDPQRAYFGVDTTGVWRSDDGGQNWRPMFSGFDAQGSVSVVVDPVNPDIVLAAGFFGFERKRSEPYPNRIQGIYRTTNGGETWQKVYTTGFYRRFGKGTLFAFVPADKPSGNTGTVFAASSDDGLLRSEDNGLTWKKVGVTLATGGDIGEIHDLKLMPGDSGNSPTLLTVTEKGLYAIRGNQAVKIGKGLPDVSGLPPEARAKRGPMTVAVSPANKNVVLIAAGEAGIWRSTNRGDTFSETSFNGFDKLKSTVLSANITDVSLSPVDANIAYARAHLVGLKPMYSNDGGKSWNYTKNSNADNLLIREGFYFSSPFAPHPTEAKTALHASNGREKILQTKDGGESWHYSGRGFSGAALHSMSFAGPGEFYVGLVDYGLWHTSDNGYSFTEIPLNRMFGSQTIGSMDVRKNADNSRTILLSLGQWVKRGLALSHNGGKTWTYNDQVSTGKGTAFLHPEQHNFMLIGGYASTNGGKQWNKIGNTLTGELICFVVDKNDYTFYAFGEKNKKAVLHKSSDLGKTWAQVSVPMIIPLNDIKDLAVSPLGIFAATTGGIYHVDPKYSAAAWQKLENFPRDAHGSSFASSITINPSDPREIWVSCLNPGTGKGQGLVKSTDGGKTWQTENNSSVPLFTMTKVTINPFDNTVYAGTYFGIYRLKRP